MSNELIATSLRIPADVAAQYEALAAELGRSRSSLMNQALVEFLHSGLEDDRELAEAIADADAGRFVPQAELEAFWAEMGTPEEWAAARREAAEELGLADRV